MRKKNAADGKCHQHLHGGDRSPTVMGGRSRSRSPRVRADAASAASASSAARITTAIANLLATLDILQDAINEIDDAVAARVQ